MQPSSLEQQRACAVLLAATAKSYLPILTPIWGAASNTGFYYDFLCEQDVDDTVLTLLTEEMRRKIGQKEPLERLTFVPRNGSEFLRKNQPTQAALLDESEVTTVDLVKCGSFYDICQEPTAPSCEDLREFLLYEIGTKEAFYPGLGDVTVARIYGAVFEDRKSVKNFFKQVALAKKQDPTMLADQLGLIYLYPEFDARPFWAPRGLQVYEKIVSAWKTKCSTHKIEFVSSPPNEAARAQKLFLYETHQKKNILPVRIGEWITEEQDLLPQDCEGLFNTIERKSDCIHRLVSDEAFEAELISSLQFMHELLSMMGLEFWHVICCCKAKSVRLIQDKVVACLTKHGFQFVLEENQEPNAKFRLELRAKDLRIREWKLSELEITSGKFPMTYVLKQISFSSLERALALKLERDADFSIL